MLRTELMYKECLSDQACTLVVDLKNILKTETELQNDSPQKKLVWKFRPGPNQGMLPQEPQTKKIPIPGLRSSLMSSCSVECKRLPKYYRLLLLPLLISKQLKTPPKTPWFSDTWPKGPKLHLMWKPPPWGLAFMVSEGTSSCLREGSHQQSYQEMMPMNNNHDQHGKVTLMITGGTNSWANTRDICCGILLKIFKEAPPMKSQTRPGQGWHQTCDPEERKSQGSNSR